MIHKMFYKSDTSICDGLYHCFIRINLFEFYFFSMIIYFFIQHLWQAPAVDVVAVGLADGRVILHNIKFDETIVTFTHDWGPVTAVSFRTGKL